MKFLLIHIISLFVIQKGISQIKNVKAGSWSDHSIWSNTNIPVSTDIVNLDFDIIVDINATCKSLHANGHNIIINTGVKLSIVGNDQTIDDTSIIFTKKRIFHNFQDDSSIQVFKNNTINGVKGYIVKEYFNQDAPQTSLFKYNDYGQLIEINISYDMQAPIIKVVLTWDKNKIIHIKWDETGSYGMDRDYHYSMLNDTLLIRYKQDIGRGIYLDSTAVTIFADSGLHQLYKISKTGFFDYYSSLTGTYSNDRKFDYSGQNILSVKYYGQTYYTKSDHPYSIEIDSSVNYFTRDNQINPLLAEVENNFFGKAFKLLCYDQNDSIAGLLDGYFNTGNSFADIHSSDRFQDYFQDQSVYNASLDPLTEAKINYTVRRDGIFSDQQNGYKYKKLVYGLDSLKRIKTIQEYNPFTNELVTEFFFAYP